MLSNAALALLILLLFLASLGLSIALTFLPCYASLCVEEFFPYETRLHIASFYSILVVAALGLTLRATFPRIRTICAIYVARKPLPLVGRRITLGGLAMTIWLVGMHFPTFAFWYPSEVDFYDGRAEKVGWDKRSAGGAKLATVGMVGHACDVFLGILVLPISRGAVLGKLFKVETATLLFVHKMIGYLLFAAMWIHAIPFFAWVPTFAKASEQFKDTFFIDNPTISASEAERRGPWFMAVVPVGLFAMLIFIVIVITSLPRYRRTMYNMFYYAHLIGSVAFLIFTAVHASTDFYFLIPGLVLWIVDWAIRARWLSKKGVEGKLGAAGDGWFRITLPPSIKSKTGINEKPTTVEPLQAYFLNFPNVSKLQCHAFTAASTGTVVEGPSFLFRRSDGKKQNKLDKEWTWKLAKLVQPVELEGIARQEMKLNVRLEGPYITPSPSLYISSHVLCITGGTGITGALCIASYWLQTRSHETDARFSFVWTVRDEAAARVKEIENLRTVAADKPNMSIVVHITGGSNPRLSSSSVLQDFFSLPASTSKNIGPSSGRIGNGWVYCSGPPGLLDATESACVQYRHSLKESPTTLNASDTEAGHGNTSVLKNLEWYCARWEV